MSKNSHPNASRQEPPPPLLVTSTDATRQWLNTCPNAQSLSAQCPELSAEVLVILPCKQWGCPHCARQKIAELAARTRGAAPNRLLTLTVDPKQYQTPREAFDATRGQVPELVRRLRKRFGELEYLRVTELTRRGYPHYHMLIRSKYLPQPVVKKDWNELTGAMIVDLRKVRQSFQAYTYLVKYLSKLHRIEWTERHVSYSRQFFPPRDDPPKSPYTFEQSAVVASHPATLLQQSYAGCTITRKSPSLLVIDPSANPGDSW